MDVNSGMLIGAWSRKRDILAMMRGGGEGRVILEARIRTAPGTVLLVDGIEVTVPENGILAGLVPEKQLCIASESSVHAQIEYSFEGDEW